MPSIESRLAEILWRSDDLRRRGDFVSVEDLCQDCPDLIEEVRQRLEAAPLTGRAADTFDSIQAIDPDTDDDDLRPGSEPIPGYSLVQRLGRGGYGEVWKALAPGGFSVALKFVLRSADHLHVEQRALEIIKTLRHPNLLTTVGSWQTPKYLVIAMELADRTLQDRYHEAVAHGESGIPRDELLEYLYEAAKGIDFLNGQQQPQDGSDRTGVQHRDIKPENILMVGSGVKIADFGLARLLEGAQTGHTGNLTHMYAAPEFFKGRTTQHSDQYSLAITYCQLRAGKVPFHGSPAEVMYGHLTQPPDLSMLPETERPVVQRALSKTPTERWSSCLAFVHALRIGISRGQSPERSVKRPSATPLQTVGLTGLVVALLSPLVLVCLYISFGGFNLEVTEPTKIPSATLTDVTSAAGSNSNPSKSSFAGTRSSPHLATPTGPVPISTTPDQTMASPSILSKSEIRSKSTGMKLLLIPAGSFLMGSSVAELGRQHDEGPQQTIRISRPFYFGKFEVTQDEFAMVMGMNPSYFSKSGTGSGNSLRGQDTRQFPVEEVSWYDAIEFCNKLSVLDGRGLRYQMNNVDRSEGAIRSADVSLMDGTGYRLPTEAEWEYACRQTTTTPFHFGSVLNGIQANVNGNFPYGTATDGTYLAQTTIVGSYSKNSAGLFDMHGNVMEWCWDIYDEKAYESRVEPTDPVVTSGSEYRVLRGGSWGDNSGMARSAYRVRMSPSSRYYTIGFRIVTDVAKNP